MDLLLFMLLFGFFLILILVVITIIASFKSGNHVKRKQKEDLKKIKKQIEED